MKRPHKENIMDAQQSPPARGRGLKPLAWGMCGRMHWVAPRAGAWIETAKMWSALAGLSLSPPARGRGLKPVMYKGMDIARRVAPRAGAWIETRPEPPTYPPELVAPRAGAWIETTHSSTVIDAGKCRPPRGGVD